MRWAYVFIPLGLLALVVGVFAATDPLAPLGVATPPIETLTIERTVLDETGISVTVRAGGSEPVAIAQIQVDGAYWQFEQTPPGPLPRLRTATIHLPYPWVENETHALLFVTASGVTFEHVIDVATNTPRVGWSGLLAYALLGLYVGVVPVGLGLLFYPFLRTLGTGGMQFLLALTIGLLAFLLIDTVMEGLELAEAADAAFQGPALVLLPAAAAFLALLAFGRRGGKPPVGVALATYIALGIGLHNLGEGLAIGAAFAIGEAALGSFLVIGFTLHNVTEGIGIAAPMVERRPPVKVFVGLAALAGLPAVIGTWIGAFAYSPHWSAVFLGIGAGAILQVVVEVARYLSDLGRDSDAPAILSSIKLGGFCAGLAIMYGTAILVKF